MINSLKNNNQNFGKTIKGVSVIILLILMAYCLFSYVFFFVVPSCLDVDKNKRSGEGYLYPLSIVDPNDSSEYMITLGDPMEPYIIDDSDFIKKYKDTFVVYKSKWCFELQDYREFVVYKDGEQISFTNIGTFPTALCYDDFFTLKCKKISSLSEYCEENNIEYH